LKNLASSYEMPLGMLRDLSYVHVPTTSYDPAEHRFNVEPYFRDIVGPFAHTDENKWILYAPIADSGDYGMVDRREQFLHFFRRNLARSLGIEMRILPFYFQGGNFLPIGEKDVVLTQSIFAVNRGLDEIVLEQQVGRLGRRPLLIPTWDTLGHSDIWLFEFSNTVFLPRFTPQSLRSSDYPERGRYFNEQFDQAAEAFRARGYDVEHLPIPLPYEFFGRIRPVQEIVIDAETMVSPLNALVFEEDGKMPARALIPWPRMGAGRRWPDARFHPGYQREIIEKLAKVGLRKVTFVPFFPSWRAALHCLSAKIPHGVLFQNDNSLRFRNLE
jgi:hypothetical protein